ncbi:hypothetical protein GE300_14875 [Rhodobacteraceae bacterium 2CG4]|uniref:HTH DNA binding domain-containing protein n=1 Tax=Halovulum marinum TaxID=2662447 RepID=A0A6L5Z2T6_9RHOB|nr:hypothetical protein [Halovulum marinum]MSU90883.1 hypothetical protein [Halovulum marinum]
MSGRASNPGVPRILRAEIAAARIEGILLADPALARHWRTGQAFVEAAASVGLEDIRLSAAAIMMRLTSNRTQDIDARGAEQGRRLIAVMARPPLLAADPDAGLRRIEAAASPVGHRTPFEDRLEGAEYAGLVARALEADTTPIIAALRGAAEYALRSRRSAPAAERLLFMALESEARARSRGDAGAAGRWDGPDLLAPAEAHWIAAPSAALTHGRYQVWSPISGISTLVDALEAQVARELGHLGTLRHELAKLDAAAAAARGRSRMADFVGFVKRQPILTSGQVMEDLGVTRATALSLIGTLEGQGSLVDFTARRSARFWATPTLAARLRHGSVRARPQAAGQGREAGKVPELDQPRTREDEEARLEELLGELDDALRGVDEVMRRG